MNVVVIDSAHLAGEADFPMLDLPKFGWQQYPELAPAEVIERCWRADVIVTTDTPVDRATIDKAFKLSLIVAAGERSDHIDGEAARARGITVCHVPGLQPSAAGQVAAICREVVAIINAHAQGQARNVVA